MGVWESAVDRIERSSGGRRLGYTGRIRSQGREAERIARAVLHASCRPDAILISTFWWEKVKNFGDLLTPVLLRDMGIVPVLTPPAEADLVGVGSLIQHLPSDFEGALWGTGLIHDREVRLPGAVCLALRGELTRERLGSPPVDALGDPGLLLPRRVRRPGITHDIGVVSHYAHTEDAWPRTLLDRHGRGPWFGGSHDDRSVLWIDVARGPLAVARQVASCRRIVSTSLHGVITADAFGIPAMWVRMSTALYGGDFKFHDHESVVRPPRPRGVDAADAASLRDLADRAVAANPAAVARAQAALAAAARRIPETVRHRRVRTWQVPVAGRGRPVHSHV